MTAIRRALASIELADIALPSNLTYGSAIARRGGVEMVAEEGSELEAWAGGLDGGARDGGGGRRRVRMWIDDGELAWRCTGNPKDHEIFCKHCVAVAVHLRGVA